jgi:hypothetical protein
MPQASSVRKQLRAIRRSVSVVQRALDRLARSLREPDAGRRRLNLSPKRRAALKIHGQYLGYVRQLKPRQKSQVKSVQATRGYAAAIALAKRLAKR